MDAICSLDSIPSEGCQSNLFSFYKNKTLIYMSQCDMQDTCSILKKGNVIEERSRYICNSPY